MDRRADAFVYEPLPARVLFGAGRRADVAGEVARLGCARPLIVTSPEQHAWADEIAATFEAASTSRFCEAAMHTPWHTTVRALDAVARSRADCVIAIGGGSAIGLSKAIALQTDLPQIVLPTTYAGSEVTPIIGETRDGEKRTQRTLKVLPEVVIYDVELTTTLPPAMSAASGLNAIAHAVEALYATDGNPITSLMAEEGMASLASALPDIVRTPSSIEARRIAQYGAWLCGTCLGAVSMGLHHKICHVLGGSFDLPHAQTHAIMIAHVAAYNADAAPAAMTRIARALNAQDAWSGLHELARALNMPLSLKAIGMPEDGTDVAIERVTQNAYSNPRTPDARTLRIMLTRAWNGEPPARVV
ncbi:maleylacetate reductase [Caballeronia sp. BR00000012568055]|uniref:maleylacetate reductase n=1 Tax=Caballeronia sp. BR00000012568055 TaxID=2918761 RepID=UPI0023F71D3B|nr:maleylacetate reductase [Caballeronia sp. BR00000012568055]